MFCFKCGEKNQDQAHYCSACGAAFNTAAHELATQGYGGFWYRTIAFMIDNIMIGLANTILVALFWGWIADSEGLGSDTVMLFETWAYLLNILLTWLYFTVFEASLWQATPGKWILGLKVIDAHGERLGMGRANARFWGKLLSCLVLGIGFFMVAFTRKKQGLHDMLARTYVLKVNNS